MLKMIEARSKQKELWEKVLQNFYGGHMYPKSYKDFRALTNDDKLFSTWLIDWEYYRRAWIFS